MKISIEKKGTLIRQQAKLDLNRKFAKEISEQLEIEKKSIIERTRSGRDIRGQFFQGYTDKYKPRREKLGLQTHPVDLTITGSLLDTIETKIIATGNRIEAILKIAKQNQLKAEGLSKKREFFGLSQERIKEFGRFLKNINVSKVIKNVR